MGESVVERESLFEYCKANSKEYLLAQWDRARNEDVSPSSVSRGSHKKVWWICDKGHEWQATVKSRVRGCNCPICTNRETRAGENDLATTRPEIAGEWHPTKNGILRPNMVTAGAHGKVWWLGKCGHEWQASISARARNGDGCPVCTGKVILPGVNDLASAFPAVAAQWHPTKNEGLRPDGVSPYSNRRVWWVCELGHEYQATVASRTHKGSGCPYCTGRKVLVGFNDLATLEPQVSAQWHPALNGDLTPQMVTCGAHRKVWWQCPDGHVWKAVVHSRTDKRKCGCPVCAGKTKIKEFDIWVR